MSRIDYVNTMLNEFGTHYGLSDLQLDEQASVTVTNDDFVVSFRYQEAPVEMLWLVVDLGEVTDAEIEVLNKALEFAFTSWVNNAFTLGLNHRGDRLHGLCPLPVVTLDGQHLRQQFELLMAHARAFTH